MTLVWVRLPNIPPPFWHHKVLEDIGNTLGKFKKIDIVRAENGIFTYARIFVEINLSKGIPDHRNLKDQKFCWSQVLDYENTACRCHICYQTCHLQHYWSQEKKNPKKKKKTTNGSKG